MPKKTLTIEGITFPKFSKGSSKRNFRLIFYIAYKAGDGKNKTVIATKPSGGAWQWKNSKKDFFLSEAADLGDSVKLDVSPLRFGADGFTAEDYKIAEIDGQLTSIAVQFVDVHNSSVLDFLKQKVLPKVIEELKKAGFNPIDLLPVPGVVTGIIKSRVKIEDLAGKVEEFLLEEGKDKVLHRLNQKYKNEKLFEISGRKQWDDEKTGTYGIVIGFE